MSRAAWTSRAHWCRRLGLRAGTALVSMLLLLGAAARAAGEIVDDAGQRTRLDAAPARVVSLLPSLTETVCALGACERLVGVDRYSNWPASVQKLPQLGGGLDPNIEAVVAARPDVVLIGTSSRAAVRLRALGLKVVALEPRTRADQRRVTRLLGRLLRVDGADALVQRIDDGVATAAASFSAMIAVPTGSSVVAPLSADRTRLNASDDSGVLSLSRVTLTVLAVSPAAKLRLPLVATKSEPAIAVPSWVA